MITYNGIELDYKPDTLQSLIIKGGLTKIENLTDRTGTSSTQFNLPRTAKNELAFDNITTDGAQSQTSGTAYITLDGNVFSVGTLYVKGFADDFSCIFMGEDNDLIKTLREKPLYKSFNELTQVVYNDTNVILGIEAELGGSLGQDITYHFGHPQEAALQSAGEFKFENIAPFFNIRTLINKMFNDEGKTLTSNFLDSDYGQSLDWSNFGGTHLSSNTFQTVTNSITAASSGYINLGTALSANNSITPTTFVGSSLKYVLDNDATSIEVKGEVFYTSVEDIKSCQLYVIMFRPPVHPITIPSPLFSTLGVYNDAGLLQEGTNYLNFKIDRTFLAGDYILFGYETILNDGFSYPTSGGSIGVPIISISNDNIQVGDALNWVNYAGTQTQYEFLKKFLVQFNLVMDVDGDEVYIELQDNGIEPVGATPASLPSIAASTFNLDDLVNVNEIENEIDYLQGNLVHLSQKIQSNEYVTEQQLFEYQKLGSYLYRLDTFNNSTVETYSGGFNTLLDYVDFSSVDFLLSGLSYSTTWEDYASSRFGHFSEVYNEKYGAMDFTKSDTTTQSVDALINWSRPIWFSRTWKALFINTLNQKKNNRIKTVIFKDELGTIVNNRTEYIFKDQVYKIVEWSYDVVSRLVKAKLIMK